MDSGFFLAFFFIIGNINIPSILAQENSKSTSTCPVDFQCGDLGTMNFPFFNLSHPRNCGLCIVDCEAKPRP
ncbi:hypothetical protein ACH5RR_030133, partial [Cinchona calisaya]